MKKNDWDEHKKLILFEMQENGKRLEKIEALLGQFREDISGLKVKASLVGGSAGIIGTAVVQLVFHLFK